MLSDELINAWADRQVDRLVVARDEVESLLVSIRLGASLAQEFRAVPPELENALAALNRAVRCIPE